MDTGMENKVRAFTRLCAEKIWDIGRHKLQAYGMHRTLCVLDPLGPLVISEMLVFVLDKIASAVYKQVDVKALRRNIKYSLRQWIQRSHPAPIFVV